MQALNNALTTFNGSVIVAGDKTTLKVAIEIATKTLETNTRVEGNAVGNVTKAAKDLLSAAILTAKGIFNSPVSKTQVELDDATQNLNTALTTFNGAVVGDITSELTAPITLAKTSGSVGSISSTYTLGAGETLNVISDGPNVVVPSSTALALTPGAAGTANVTVQVMKGGQVIKTGTVLVTVAP